MDNKLTTPTDKKDRKWLLLSIGLNCFLFGILAGALPSTLTSAPVTERLGPHGEPPLPHHGGPKHLFDFIADTLPDEEGNKLRSIISEEHKGIHSSGQEMSAIVRKIARILQQEKPDTAELHLALDEIHKSGTNLHEEMAQSFERIAKELNWESRKKISSILMDNSVALLPPPPPEE